MKKFIVRVVHEEVVDAKDDECAEEFAKIHLKQTNRYARIISVTVMPDDEKPCEYGKINRTCDGTKCNVCEREEWLQAMNEDASDRKYGLMDD